MKNDRADDARQGPPLSLLRLIKGVWFWTAGSVFTLFICLVVCLVHASIILTNGVRDGRRAHVWAICWGRGIFKMTPGWTIGVEGQENLPKDRAPAVLVCNHESMADVFAMYFLKIQFRWLAKDEVFRLPMVGRAMRYCDYVRVLRGDKGSHTQAMDESSDRLDKGVAMFFFPEGTRSADGKIQGFKPGAFRLAQKHQVPVVPIVIHGAHEMMPKGAKAPREALVTIKVLPPMAPPPATTEDLDEYIAGIRRIIVTEHDSLVRRNHSEVAGGRA